MVTDFHSTSTALQNTVTLALGWLYVVCGVAALVLLAWSTSRRRTHVPQETRI